MPNLHCRFVLCNNGQIYRGDFAKFCGLLRMYELYGKELILKSWHDWVYRVKFIYSEKAKKIDNVTLFFWHFLVFNVKNREDDFVNFNGLLRKPKLYRCTYIEGLNRNEQKAFFLKSFRNLNKIINRVRKAFRRHLLMKLAN